MERRATARTVLRCGAVRFPHLVVFLASTFACAAPISVEPSVAGPPSPAVSPVPVSPAALTLEQRAQRVTIVRDQWGVPHIYGQTDADVVFGLMYAQAEDDFNRVEVNYLNAMGRLAEAEGEGEVFRDLRMKMFIDPDELRAQYEESPAWLRELMDAYAAGLNYYLQTHPQVQPKVITRFEPWMALSFSEGSIGGDIEQVSLGGLAEFYGEKPKTALRRADASRDLEPRGSNGFAIAPALSASGHALLLINPHTSFFFRSEVHLVSEEGLNAYGAVTWGQFFVYQGFNERAGWMHTSSRADAIDWYLETVVEQGGALYYQYGDELRPLPAKVIEVPYRTEAGVQARAFTTYRTHHGPIVRAQDGKWMAIRLMEQPRLALTQATDYASFDATMDLHTNSSNNTVFADASGNIAYWHGNFVPVRDPKFDWQEPVDGSDPATEWHGVHATKDLVTVVNPPNGWIQNTNNTPYSAAGEHSPNPAHYRAYMAPDPENARGVHAVKVLSGIRGVTLDSLIAAAYDPELTGLATLVPSLVRAYDEAKTRRHRKALAEPIEVLRAWNLASSADSVATSLAVYWAQHLWDESRPRHRDQGSSMLAFIEHHTTAEEKLEALLAAMARLDADFGSWRTPWGEINRFQRITGDIEQPFDDAAPSLPVGFASAHWGSLASFGARTYPGTKRMYGTSGNSFVAVVEFGPRVRAKAILSGGVSGDPASPHFADQAQMYSRGEFRDVLFYREDVERGATRTYHPGQ